MELSALVGSLLLNCPLYHFNPSLQLKDSVIISKSSIRIPCIPPSLLQHPLVLLLGLHPPNQTVELSLQTNHFPAGKIARALFCMALLLSRLTCHSPNLGHHLPRLGSRPGPHFVSHSHPPGISLCSESIYRAPAPMNGTYLAQCLVFRVMAGAVTLEKILVGWEDNMHFLNLHCRSAGGCEVNMILSLLP